MPNAIHVSGFHHVAIRAFDFDASVGFYSETLGLPIAHAWGEGAARGALLDTGNGNFLEIFAGGASESQPEGAWFHIALACTDVASAIETVRKSGRPITMEPKEIVIPSTPPLPVRIAFFLGPNGESVELFQTL